MKVKIQPLKKDLKMLKLVCSIVLFLFVVPCFGQESSFNGSWSGEVTMPNGSPSTVYLEISGADSSEKIEPKIEITSPGINLRQCYPVAGTVLADNEELSFTIEHDKRQYTVNLKKSELSIELNVEWATQPLSRTEINSNPTPSNSTFAKWPGFSQADLWSNYSGVIKNRFGDIHCTLQLTRLNESWIGVVSLDKLDLERFPLTELSVSEKTVTFKIEHARSLDFEGTFDDKQIELTGQFSQSGIVLPCKLTKTADAMRTDTALPAEKAIADEFPGWGNRSWMVRRHLKPKWAITNVSVVDINNGEIRSGQNIVIDGDLVVSISDTPVKAELKSIDGSGKFVIPGLIDMHAHIQPMDINLLPETELAKSVLTSLLDHGVTTVRALPLYSEFASATAGRTNLDPSLGPTIIPGSGVFEREPQRSSWGFRDSETARRWVQREAMLGTRWIKVYNKMDVRSLTQIVRSAEENGMFVCGHAQDVPPHVASELGMHTIEHATSIPLSCLKRGLEIPQEKDLGRRTAWLWENVEPSKLDKLMALFSKNKTGWVPTLVVMEAIAVNGGRLGGTPLDESTQQSLGDAVKKSAALAVKMSRNNVLVGLGTDFPVEGIRPGVSAHRELEILVEAGATPLEALQIGTINSAKLLRIDGVTGDVCENKLADLVVLDANPLEDIANVTRIEFVVHAGVYHKPASQSRENP